MAWPTSTRPATPAPRAPDCCPLCGRSIIKPPPRIEGIIASFDRTHRRGWVRGEDGIDYHLMHIPLDMAGYYHDPRPGMLITFSPGDPFTTDLKFVNVIYEIVIGPSGRRMRRRFRPFYG